MGDHTVVWQVEDQARHIVLQPRRLVHCLTVLRIGPVSNSNFGRTTSSLHITATTRPSLRTCGATNTAPVERLTFTNAVMRSPQRPEADVGANWERYSGESHSLGRSTTKTLAIWTFVLHVRGVESGLWHRGTALYSDRVYDFESKV